VVEVVGERVVRTVVAVTRVVTGVGGEGSLEVVDGVAADAPQLVATSARASTRSLMPSFTVHPGFSYWIHGASDHTSDVAALSASVRECHPSRTAYEQSRKTV
jgi:hypothetical protein